MESLTIILFLTASFLSLVAGAGAIGILIGLANRCAHSSEQAVLANLFVMQSKQLMAFHKAGNTLANSEAQLAAIDADVKRAEADRLQAETNLVNAQRRETEANTPEPGVRPSPSTPPKFGPKGRTRVGETAYSPGAQGQGASDH